MHVSLLQLNQLIGKRDTFTSQIKEHHKELAKPIYKDIDDQFRQMLIKVKTTEMATSDLEKYYHALNKYAPLPSPLQGEI
jgi:DNA repair protein RAD50